MGTHLRVPGPRLSGFLGHGFSILSHETAFHAQQNVKVPLLYVYSADDSLVPAFEAQMMAGYEVGNPLQPRSR